MGLLLLSVLSVLQLALGYPNGAPDVACDSFRPFHVNRTTSQPFEPRNESPPVTQPSIDSCPYQITYSGKFTPGQDITLTISPLNRDDYFRGYMLSVMEEVDEQGVKNIIPVGEFGRLTKSVCRGRTATHSNDQRKGSEDVIWIAPLDSSKKTFSIWLTVVKSYSRYWVNCAGVNISAVDALDSPTATTTSNNVSTTTIKHLAGIILPKEDTTVFNKGGVSRKNDLTHNLEGHTQSNGPGGHNNNPSGSFTPTGHGVSNHTHGTTEVRHNVNVQTHDPKDQGVHTHGLHNNSHSQGTGTHTHGQGDHAHGPGSNTHGKSDHAHGPGSNTHRPGSNTHGITNPKHNIYQQGTKPRNVNGNTDDSSEVDSSVSKENNNKANKLVGNGQNDDDSLVSTSSEDLNSEGKDESGNSIENSVDISDNRSGSSLNSAEKETRRKKFLSTGIQKFDTDIKQFLKGVGKSHLLSSKNAAASPTNIASTLSLILFTILSFFLCI